MHADHDCHDFGLEAKTFPGDGVVTGMFGTVKRDDGTTQVTYAGAPIYYFAKDTKAGDVTGQGVGGVWFDDGLHRGATLPESRATDPWAKRRIVVCRGDAGFL